MTNLEKSVLAERFYVLDEDVVAVRVHEPGTRPDGVPEAMVHDLWQWQQFEREGLLTERGEEVSVIHPGLPNKGDGPDFSDARIHIDGVAWIGQVEIHLASADWYAHNHHLDERYNSVVLHVTLDADAWTGSLRRKDGSVIPEVVLAPRLNAPLRALVYEFRTRERTGLPCSPAFAASPVAEIQGWVEALTLERLRDRSRMMEAARKEGMSLDDVLYVRCFTALGYSPNARPMTELALRVPREVAIALEDRRDLEALYLGTAGLLPSTARLVEADRATADYCMDLRDRFNHLARLHQLEQMSREAWQFGRMRPANFPTLRIAQAVHWLLPGGLLHHDPARKLIRALRTSHPIRALRKVTAASAGPYWNEHVRPEKRAAVVKVHLGSDRIDTLIVNVFAPWLLLMAEREGDPALRLEVRELLGAVRPSSDEVTRQYEALGFVPRHAGDTQGLHQLHRTRCSEGRCLNCPVGRRMLTE
jgi:hypothetical protein